MFESPFNEAKEESDLVSQKKTVAAVSIFLGMAVQTAQLGLWDGETGLGIGFGWIVDFV